MKKIAKIIVIILIIFLIIFLFKSIKNYNIHKILNGNYETKYVINDLYKSNEINYRLLLNKKEKALYEIIIEKVINFENDFVLNLSNFNYNIDSLYFSKISKIVDAILMDHPELIHLGVIRMSKTTGSELVTVSPQYIMNKDGYKKSIEEIKKIIEIVKKETAVLSEYDKVKYVYDYLGKNNTYGDVDNHASQSAYSAFSSQLSPVCAGYSKASQILLYNVGIKSLLIHGDSEYALFLGIPHAWNIVEIESEFYLYDVTMSSNSNTTKSFYRGFLIDDKNHSPSYKKTYPYLNGKKYKR